MRFLASLLGALLCAAGVLAAPIGGGTVGWQASYSAPSAAAIATAQKHLHIVTFYFENEGFDWLLQNVPGAHGLDPATVAALPPQTDPWGNIYPTLPQGDIPIPANLPNSPWNASAWFNYGNEIIDSPTHLFYNEQYQIDAGNMDRFVAWSSSKGAVMGYYDLADMHQFMGTFAATYTTFDHFHHSGFGGSFFNHVFMIRPIPPVYPAPLNLGITAVLDSRGYVPWSYGNTYVSQQTLTPDGYAVNTINPVNWFVVPGCGPPTTLPTQNSATTQTIGDALTNAKVSWIWYAQYLTIFMTNQSNPLACDFVPWHQPFLFFSNWNDPTSTAFQQHIADESAFFSALAADTLPSVAWVKPAATDDCHPSQNDPALCQPKMQQYVNAVLASPSWKAGTLMAIFTFDENGGTFDHIPPWNGDRWGPGSRIPMIAMSPYLKMGFVDHNAYETLSITRLIQTTFGLPDWLTATNPTRAATIPDLTIAFDVASGALPNSWNVPTPGTAALGPVQPSCPTTTCTPTCPQPVCPQPVCPQPVCNGAAGSGGGEVNVNFANMFAGATF